MDNIDFTKQLLKGRIAEIIFEMIFRNEVRWNLIPFGYEYNTPEMVRYRYHTSEENRSLIDNFSNSPDFIGIDKNEKVHLVEVKYRKQLHENTVKQIADDVGHRWPGADLFLVTREALYFSSCKDISQNNGQMTLLDTSLVPQEVQNRYLELVEKFIPLNIDETD